MKDLASRRQALLEQGAEHRRVAAAATADLRRGLSSVERAAGILRYLGRKPLAVGIGIAAIALVLVKPRQTATWLGYAFTGYTMFRRLRRIFISQAPN